MRRRFGAYYFTTHETSAASTAKGEASGVGSAKRAIKLSEKTRNGVLFKGLGEGS